MPNLELWQWLLVELGLIAFAWLMARSGAMQRGLRAVAGPLGRLAEHPVRCFWVLFATSVVLRLCLLPIAPVPIPLYHDEFSYLLGADTFSHLRLTNPTPPVAIAFETIHTNVWPTYQSMYMPGPALLLTVGKVLGSPWIAVLLAVGLFCALLYWAVSAWLPRRYALLAALIALALTGTLNWWFDSYFCLALSCIGTTLVLGSLPRIERSRRWQTTFPLAGGLAILMLTRPYEGFCVVFPLVLVLVWRLRREGWARVAGLAAVPVSLLCLVGAWLLFYNWRGTGHPLLFPYMLNYQRYHITGAFLFSANKPIPHYDLGMLRRFYTGAEPPQYAFMRNHPWQFLIHKVTVYYTHIALGFGLLAVTGLVFLVRRAEGEALRWAPVLAFAGFAINVVLMAWAPFPQYAAPAAPLLCLLAVFGMYALAGRQFGRVRGSSLLAGLLLGELLLALSLLGWRISESGGLPEPQYVSKDRAHVAREVLSHPGRQLCLVRYIRYHDGWQEWVFNGADLQGERLLWARSLSPATDQAVIRAFPGREVWLVTPDDAGRLVQPYSPAIPFTPIEADPSDEKMP